MTDLSSLLAELAPYNARLVAISKTHPPEAIRKLYDQGQRMFGENRAKELSSKVDALPEDIEWHMVGHLQRNKVKYLSEVVAMIQSVDSIRLLKEINKEAAKANRKIPVLLQMKIAGEETKYGFTMDDLSRSLDLIPPSEYANVIFSGVMGMASFVEDPQQIRREFASLRQYFEELKSRFFNTSDQFREISMGMSGDYRIALDEGSTIVRIGSLLFGPREE